jgi:hypothetical protein
MSGKGDGAHGMGNMTTPHRDKTLITLAILGHLKSGRRSLLRSIFYNARPFKDYH